MVKMELATLINEARYSLFKLGNFSDENLPPNKDCLYHHIRSVNYQTLTWKRSFDAVINAPDPAEHGWVISTATKLSSNGC